MQIKIKNLNNKLSCPFFVHIAEKPKSIINTSQVPVDCVVINEDNGEEIKCQLIDVLILNNYILPSSLTLLSHCLTGEEFLKTFKIKAPAAYFFKKVLTNN